MPPSGHVLGDVVVPDRGCERAWRDTRVVSCIRVRAKGQKHVDRFPLPMLPNTARKSAVLPHESRASTSAPAATSNGMTAGRWYCAASAGV